MNGKEKEINQDNAEKKETVTEKEVLADDTIEIDENELKGPSSLQELADKLGGEHAKAKESRFFGRKNKDKESLKKIDELNEKLKEKEEKITELENHVKSLVAENRNQKTRIENEFRSKIRFAAEDFFRDFITVKDDFDKAMEFIPTDGSSEKDPFIQGIKHLMVKTEDTMKKHGLTSFSGMGEKFDPELHQAMSMIPVEGKEINEIVAEYVKGYKMHERILRPAMVVVASGEKPASPEKESETNEEGNNDEEKSEELENIDENNNDQ